jgi:hypothetical protein
MRLGSKATDAGESVIKFASATAVNNLDIEEPSFWRGRKVGPACWSPDFEPTRAQFILNTTFMLVPESGHVRSGSFAAELFSPSAAPCPLLVQ